MARTPKTTPVRKAAPTAQTASYQHPEAKALSRPEAGAQSRFKKSRPKKTYRYDSSLAPELQWDRITVATQTVVDPDDVDFFQVGLALRLAPVGNAARFCHGSLLAGVAGLARGGDTSLGTVLAAAGPVLKHAAVCNRPEGAARRDPTQAVLPIDRAMTLAEASSSPRAREGQNVGDRA